MQQQQQQQQQLAVQAAAPAQAPAGVAGRQLASVSHQQLLAHPAAPGAAAASQPQVPNPSQRRIGTHDGTQASVHVAPEGLPIELLDTDSDDDDAGVSQQHQLRLSTKKSDGQEYQWRLPRRILL